MGNSTDAVGNGEGVSDGGGVMVSVIDVLVSIARGAGIVGAADGVADNAGAVQANAIAKRRKSRIKERFLSDMTSSTIKFFKYRNTVMKLLIVPN